MEQEILQNQQIQSTQETVSQKAKRLRELVRQASAYEEILFALAGIKSEEAQEIFHEILMKKVHVSSRIRNWGAIQEIAKLFTRQELEAKISALQEKGDDCTDADGESWLIFEQALLEPKFAK